MTAADFTGVLAIWNNVRSGRDAEFEIWYNHEHFLERISVPGFRRGRRYEAVSGAPRYFCYYVTDTPQVLLSPAYLERLDNPTPMTRTMMSELFGDMVRTVCHREQTWGRLTGAFAVTARFCGDVPGHDLRALAEILSTDPGIARCEIWRAADQGATIAEEERLRGGDEKITACLFVDTVRMENAELVCRRLRQSFGDAQIGIYRLLCEIQ